MTWLVLCSEVVASVVAKGTMVVERGKNLDLRSLVAGAIGSFAISGNALSEDIAKRPGQASAMTDGSLADSAADIAKGGVAGGVKGVAGMEP